MHPSCSRCCRSRGLLLGPCHWYATFPFSFDILSSCVITHDFFIPLLGLPTLYTWLVGGRSAGENPQDLAYVGPQDQVVSPGFVATQIVDAYNEVRPFLFCVFSFSILLFLSCRFGG
jgi:hypothetical protein